MGETQEKKGELSSEGDDPEGEIVPSPWQRRG